MADGRDAAIGWIVAAIEREQPGWLASEADRARAYAEQNADRDPSAAEMADEIARFAERHGTRPAGDPLPGLTETVG